MKRLLLLLLSVTMCSVLCSCKEKDGGSELKSESNKTISVTFINDVEKADIWILPQTKENLKTSLWGTATISKLKPGEKKTISINDFEEGRYIVRIIDDDKAYYSANDIILKENYIIRFKTDETKYEAELVTLDQNGEAVSTTEAFQGVLGAN